MSVSPKVFYGRGLVAAVLLFVLPVVAGAQSAFQTAGHLAATRNFSSITPLDDGRLLVAGGADPSTNTLVPSEVFNPATGASTPTGTMNENRFLHAAVRLPNGRVAVFGGRDTATGLDRLSVEVYDPATNSWSIAGNLAHPHTQAIAALLPNGTVLVAGGASTPTELFDPATSAASAGGPMMEAREAFHSTVTLDNGRVLVLGGISTAPEVYDPATNSWSATGPPVTIRAAADMVRLPDGRVLVAGGIPPTGGLPLASTEIYDPATNTWSAAASMASARAFVSLDAVADGRVIASGGVDETLSGALDSTEFFNPATGTWSAGPQMPVARAFHTGAVPSNGSVYLLGGTTSTQVDMLARDQAPTADAGADVVANGCNACANGAIVSAAGSSDDGPLTYVWSIGATVLAQSVAPVDTAMLSLPIGTHAVTLTVRDALGQEDTDTVMVTIHSVDTAYLAQIGALETALAVCEANSGGGAGNIDALMNALESHLRARFKAPSFELPGAAGLDELARLLQEIQSADNDVQKKLFRALGGKHHEDTHEKKHGKK